MSTVTAGIEHTVKCRYASQAIVEPYTYELVQQEFLRRKSVKGRYSGVDIFASRIKCGECGAFYGSKVWHSNSKYRKVIYRCNNKYDGEHSCKTPSLQETEIKVLFIRAVNQLIDVKDEVIANLEQASSFTSIHKRNNWVVEKKRLNTYVQDSIKKQKKRIHTQQVHRCELDI